MNMFVVTVDDDVTTWDVAQAVLESIEQGSSRHCLWMEGAPTDPSIIKHHRLGVIVQAIKS